MKNRDNQPVTLSSRKRRRTAKSILVYILLIAACIIVAFPFFWMLSNSIKTKDEIWAMPPKLLPATPQWINYKDALNDGKFFRYMWNSTYTATLITLISLTTAAMFAYALTYIRFRGRGVLYAVIMVTYIMPAAATHIPSYILLSKMGLMDTHAGYIFSCAASIFNIFFLKTSFSQINPSIIEAARVDGASHWRIFTRVVVPMSKSSFMTLGILEFIADYNNYLWPSLVLKSKEKYFVSMGLKAFFTAEGAYGMKWGAIMAACVVIILPLLIIFLIGQKWIINGITNDSAVKG